MISGKSDLAKHTEFRSFATLNVACNSLSESARAIGSLEEQSMPLTGMKQPFLSVSMHTHAWPSICFRAGLPLGVKNATVVLALEPGSIDRRSLWEMTVRILCVNVWQLYCLPGSWAGLSSLGSTQRLQGLIPCTAFRQFSIRIYMISPPSW